MRMVKTTIHLISNKTTLHVQNLFLYIKSLFWENVCVPVHSVFFTAPHFHLGRRQLFLFFHRRYIIFMFLFRRNWAPLLFNSNSSSFPVIQVNVDIKIKWKERLILLLFLSISFSVFIVMIPTTHLLCHLSRRTLMEMNYIIYRFSQG